MPPQSGHVPVWWGNSSAEDASSQVTLVWVKLTRDTEHNLGTQKSVPISVKHVLLWNFKGIRDKVVGDRNTPNNDVWRGQEHTQGLHVKFSGVQQYRILFIFFLEKYFYYFWDFNKIVSFSPYIFLRHYFLFLFYFLLFYISQFPKGKNQHTRLYNLKAVFWQ